MSQELLWEVRAWLHHSEQKGRQGVSHGKPHGPGSDKWFTLRGSA